jgi:uncharacterized protein YkwD
MLNRHRNLSFGFLGIEVLEPRRLMTVSTGPTAAEQYMLEMINRARANPAAEAASLGIDLNEGLAPGTISADAKQPLAFNPMLITAARSHSQWMIDKNTFAHNEGSVDPGAQMQAAGYVFAGNWTWGQNIAFRGQTGSAPDVGTTVGQEENDLFVDAGIAGRGHRVNLMDDAFKEIGVGAESGTFQGYNSVLTSQDFATTSGNSFLTGVAFTNADHSNFYAIGEGLGGITVTATRASDGAVFTATTWWAGGYSLALAPGTYTVVATGTGLGTLTDTNVVMASHNVEQDFTPDGSSTPVTPPIVTPPVSTKGILTGLVFRDNNGNAIRDAGEKALGQWRAYLDLNGDGVYERNEPSALSNGKGVYRITAVAGDYTVRIVQKKGFTATSNGDGQAVTITAGATVSASAFSEQKIPVVKTHKARLLQPVI